MTTEDRPEPARQEERPGSEPGLTSEPTPPAAPAPVPPATAAPAPSPEPGITSEPVPPGTTAAVPSPEPTPTNPPAPALPGTTGAAPLSPTEPRGDLAADRTLDPTGDPAGPPAEAAHVVPDAEPGGQQPASRHARGLLIACIALFVLSVGLGILTAVLASKLDREVATRDDVEETAGRFATALLTYHHEDLERSKQAVLDLSTGKFRREYEEAFDGGLDVLITETKATSEGTVTDVFVSDVEDDSASAIVVADVKVTGTAGARRGASSYIQLELVRVAGRWRVDGVTNLNFGQNGTPTGVPTTPETTTTAPPR